MVRWGSSVSELWLPDCCSHAVADWVLLGRLSDDAGAVGSHLCFDEFGSRKKKVSTNLLLISGNSDAHGHNWYYSTKIWSRPVDCFALSPCGQRPSHPLAGTVFPAGSAP